MKLAGLIPSSSSSTPSYNPINMTGVFLPNCTNDGNFEKIQCQSIPKECWYDFIC